MAYNYYQGGYYPQLQGGAVPYTLNHFKGIFQQPIQQMPMQPMAQTTPTNDMIWVLSEVEAQSYPVAPNNSVILWDKNNDVVYIKSVNMQGVPSMRVLEYKERTDDNGLKKPVEHECKCGSKFVPKEDFKALQREFEALRGEFEEYKTKSKAKTVKKAVEEVEDGE
jgi:hypothetical protein